MCVGLKECVCIKEVAAVVGADSKNAPRVACCKNVAVSRIFH